MSNSDETRLLVVRKSFTTTKHIEGNTWRVVFGDISLLVEVNRNKEVTRDDVTGVDEVRSKLLEAGRIAEGDSVYIDADAQKELEKLLDDYVATTVVIANEKRKEWIESI